MKSERLQSIDFLRGLAATMVVVDHATIYGLGEIVPQEVWFQIPYNILKWGHLGVPLFFVISGFCIHLKWAKAAQKTDDLQSIQIDFFAFWRRRFWRLYPPYIVALCGSMALLLVAYFMGRNVGSLEVYPEPKLLWMLGDFLAHITMLHGFIPIFDRNAGNSVYWTLAREEYFYILYFVFLIFRRRLGIISTNIRVMLLSIIFPVVMSFFIPFSSSLWYVVIFSPITLWIQWTLGTISVESYLGIVKLPRLASNPAMIIVWGALAYVNEVYLDFWFFGSVLWGLCFFTLINFCVRKEREKTDYQVFSRTGIGRFFIDVGIWSYSLYLIHQPAQRIVKQLLGAFARTDNPFIYSFVALLMIAVSFLVGKIFFLLIERHFITQAK